MPKRDSLLSNSHCDNACVSLEKEKGRYRQRQCGCFAGDSLIRSHKQAALARVRWCPRCKEHCPKPLLTRVVCISSNIELAQKQKRKRKGRNPRRHKREIPGCDSICCALTEFFVCRSNPCDLCCLFTFSFAPIVLLKTTITTKPKPRARTRTRYDRHTPFSYPVASLVLAAVVLLPALLWIKWKRQ